MDPRLLKTLADAEAAINHRRVLANQEPNFSILSKDNMACTPILDPIVVEIILPAGVQAGISAAFKAYIAEIPPTGVKAAPAATLSACFIRETLKQIQLVQASNGVCRLIFTLRI